MPPNSVYLVLEIMPNANLLLLQKEMQKRFVRGQTASSIRFLPWSKNSWFYGHLLEPAPLEQVPPDLDPDPPDLPDAALDEAHSAFAATLPPVSISDAIHADLEAASAAFAASVSNAINAAAKAASADFEYTATPASGAGSACPYSWSVVPSRCTRILYSTSLKTPICRIRNPLPYLSTPLDLTTLRAPSVFALAATDMPVSSHTSSGEILAIVDSGTSKHILQCRTLLANCKEAHVAVSSFPGTSLVNAARG